MSKLARKSAQTPRAGTTAAPASLPLVAAGLCYSLGHASPRAVDPRQGPGPAPEGIVWIPGGSFLMGSNEIDNALPVHTMQLTGFWMDRTEMTNVQFARFVGETD